MTVDSAYITDMSEYALTTDFTQVQFNRWLPVSIDIVDGDKLPYSTEQYDEQVFNLICHRIELKKGKLDLQSESIGGDYSYSRSTKEAAQSQWSVAYEDLKKKVTLARNKTAVLPSTGVRRSDDTTVNGFHLDANPIPRMNHPDTTIRRAP